MTADMTQASRNRPIGRVWCGTFPVGKTWDEVKTSNWTKPFKASKREKKNFEFYEEVYERLEPVGVDDPPVFPDENGLPAVAVFALIERLGLHAYCREPERLRRVLRAKACLNLSIRMWAEGIADGLFVQREFEEDPKLSWLPEWVWKALRRQSYKRGRQRWESYQRLKAIGVKPDPLSGYKAQLEKEIHT